MTVWDWRVAHAVFTSIDQRAWARELHVLRELHAELVDEGPSSAVGIGASWLAQCHVAGGDGRGAMRAVRRLEEAGAIRKVQPAAGNRSAFYSLEWRVERWSPELVPWTVSRETLFLRVELAFAARTRARVTLIDARLGARSGARQRAFAAHEGARQTSGDDPVSRAPMRAANAVPDHAVRGFLEEEEEGGATRTKERTAGVLQGAAAEMMAMLNSVRVGTYRLQPIVIAGRYADELNALVQADDVASLVALMANSTGATFLTLMTMTRTYYAGGRPAMATPTPSVVDVTGPLTPEPDIPADERRQLARSFLADTPLRKNRTTSTEPQEVAAS